MNAAQNVINIEERVPGAIIEALDSVADPEIPVLTIRDLGILRGVRMNDREVVVTITPTYSGCPAMVDIQDSIEAALKKAGVEKFSIETRLSPAWTTDWMSEEGRRKLLEYGIAPPNRGGDAAPTGIDGDVGAAQASSAGAAFGSVERSAGDGPLRVSPPRPVPCPQCSSTDTRLISEFGSTACKALHQCNACLEPFDHFKCH